MKYTGCGKLCILAVFDVGQQDGSPYMVSELLENESLRSRLRTGPLLVRKAVEYGVQIIRSLAAAHDRGIFHRDLKPENIFVTRDGHVKILNFGQPCVSSDTYIRGTCHLLRLCLDTGRLAE